MELENKESGAKNGTDALDKMEKSFLLSQNSPKELVTPSYTSLADSTYVDYHINYVTLDYIHV